MEDIVKSFAEIPSTSAADALHGKNNMVQAIKPLRREYRVCGRAVTVAMPAGDNSAVLKGISVASPGDVLVVDSRGATSHAVAGDFVIGLAQVMGLGGLVVDGSIRDCLGVLACGFPVFCRTVTSVASAKKGGGEVNVEISCGGVCVRSGDLVVGDADGVVVVPQGREEEVLAAALAKIAKDEKRAEVLQSRETARRYLDGVLGR